MRREWNKTESIADRKKRYDVALEFWQKNAHLTRIEICTKFGFTDSAIRAHMRKNGIKHPRDLIKRSDESKRKMVVRNAYNMALEQDLTATEASKWATKQHGVKIGRAEIQFYATRFDLPYLREAETFEIGKLCKYA